MQLKTFFFSAHVQVNHVGHVGVRDVRLRSRDSPDGMLRLGRRPGENPTNDRKFGIFTAYNFFYVGMGTFLNDASKGRGYKDTFL